MFRNSATGITNLLIGGWELQTVTSPQTGTSRTVTANIGVSHSDGEDRPGRIAGVSVVPSNQGPSNWINPLTFTTAVAGTYGNSDRNIITTAGVTSVDVSLFKHFAIRERQNFSFERRLSTFRIIRTSAVTISILPGVPPVLASIRLLGRPGSYKWR